MNTWPVPKKVLMDAWEVTVWWDLIDGVPQPVGVDVRSFHSSITGAPEALDGHAAPVRGTLQAVTKRGLRDLPWESVREDTRRAVDWDSRHERRQAATEQERAAASDRLEALKAHRPGTVWTREHYERVAAIYLAALAEGSTQPVAAVRDQMLPALGNPDRAKARVQASNWVRRAKELGLITNERGRF